MTLHRLATFIALLTFGSLMGASSETVSPVPTASVDAAPIIPTTHTFGMIKPDITEAGGDAWEILGLLERNGFIIEALTMHSMTREEAEAFYSIHAERPFFASLTSFMTSGPVIMFVLGHRDPHRDVVTTYRELMGATNPEKAAPGTLRFMFGTSVERNAVHGSDSASSAEREIRLCFPEFFAAHLLDVNEDEDDTCEAEDAPSLPEAISTLPHMTALEPSLG